MGKPHRSYAQWKKNLKIMQTVGCLIEDNTWKNKAADMKNRNDCQGRWGYRGYLSGYYSNLTVNHVDNGDDSTKLHVLKLHTVTHIYIHTN